MLGIITAMADERDAVLSIMKVEIAEKIHGVELHKGTINSVSSVLALSGLGKIKAARCAELMILKYKLDDNENSTIINIGTAGCLNPLLEIGDIVIANRCVQFDMDITVLKRPDGNNFIKGECYEEGDRYIYADKKVLDICSRVIKKITDDEEIMFKVILGTVATGDQFINDPEWKKKAHLEFEADCDEMEGAAIAKVCVDASVPFGIIRSISDKPKDPKICDYEKFKHLASSRCSKFLDYLTLEMLK